MGEKWIVWCRAPVVGGDYGDWSPPPFCFFYSARMELNIGAEFLLVYTPFNLFPMVIIIVIKYFRTSDKIVLTVLILILAIILLILLCLCVVYFHKFCWNRPMWYLWSFYCCVVVCYNDWEEENREIRADSVFAHSDSVYYSTQWNNCIPAHCATLPRLHAACRQQYHCVVSYRFIWRCLRHTIMKKHQDTW